MPFIKKNTGQGALASTSTRSIFIGRAKELLFFIQAILKPEEPLHNILSIWGQGGVGKTTLLHQFRNQAVTADFKEYCLTAIVDERQATPASMMEKFAHQLHLSQKFEQALRRYQEALQLLPPSRSSSPLQKAMIARAPDMAGSLVEWIPVAGPPLREVAKAATEQLLDHSQTQQERSNALQFKSPLDTLTQVFITELNHLAATKVTLPFVRTKRERRILPFFDTFEHVADEAVPWLLHSVLEMEIHPNIIFIIASREPLERSTAAGPKQWLPYYDDHTLYALPLHPFTREEASAYLAERGIMTKERIDTFWRLSHGLPLYLSLLTSSTQGMLDPTKDVVDNFLQRIPETEPTKRQLALDAALFSRPFNLDDLEALPYLSHQDRPALYQWLLRQPFVRASSLKGHSIYHDLAQELFQRYLYQHSPKTYYAVRKAMAQNYQRMLEQLQTVQEKYIYGPPTEERLELMLALVTQLFCLPEEAGHFQALALCLEILEDENEEQTQVLTKTLQDLISPLSSTYLSAHALLAIQTFLRYIETTPRLHFSKDQQQRQEWRQVTEDMLKLLLQSSSPSSEAVAHFYYLYGWGYIYLREPQQAKACFERALKHLPSFGKAYEGLGSVYYDLKEYQQAIDYFNQAQQLTPHDPAVYLARGIAYQEIKAYQQALSDLNHAFQLDRRRVHGYGDRAIVYMGLKEYQKALADLDHVLEVASAYLPTTAHTQLQRGCVFLWLKEPFQAATCFTLGYEMASKGSVVLWTRDWSMITRDIFLWAREWSTMCQQYPDAQTEQHLEAIARGDSYTACVCRGVLFWLHKNFEQALKMFQHAATLHYDPDWQKFGGECWQEWDAHFWGGMTYLMLDQDEEAQIAIEQALTLQMPPILLKPLCWFEQEKPKLYEKLIKPLLATYEV